MSPLPTKDRCKACQAPISFGITAKNKRMPLDVEPVKLDEIDPLEREKALRGLVVFTDRSSIVSATKVDSPGARELFRSHFATCPEADRFRR